MENQGIVELDRAIEVLCERLRTLEDESWKINGRSKMCSMSLKREPVHQKFKERRD